MDNVRREFIIELLETLKVPAGAFNVGTVADEIQHIPDTSLRAFHKALFGTQHAYLSGMDRIIKVAEMFKPIEKTDEVEDNAKRLIGMVYAMSDNIYKKHSETSISFDILLQAASFPNVSDEDIAILNNVAPHFNHKRLIGNISTYQNSLEQLQAFKNALNKKGENVSIENKKVQNLIGGIKI